MLATATLRKISMLVAETEQDASIVGRPKLFRMLSPAAEVGATSASTCIRE